MSIITDHQAANLLVSALEGGSNYWYNIIQTVAPKVVAQPWGADEYTPQYISYPFSDGGAVLIADIEDDSSTHFTLDKTAIERGKKLMETDNYKHHLADVIQENEDAETGDVFLQLCLFGEVLYG